MGTHGRAKQTWEVGNVVRVGFLGNFLVCKKIPTPGDYDPDKYLLLRENTKELAYYEFTPHKGLYRLG